MKQIQKIALIIFVLASCSAFVNIEKSVDKLIAKVWKDTPISKTEMALPDTLQSSIGKVYNLYVQDSLVGYACYTTAFGCQVGGCAKPNNPNTQTYETFDYMVIFNPNYQILKVDIADYPGAYGYQICRRNWLKQFTGKTPSLELNKDVDGVSGATISAQFLVEDINKVKVILESL